MVSLDCWLVNNPAYRLEALVYQLRYAEENHRSIDMPWSVRQTGVYHHQSEKAKFDLFILLHPLGNSIIESQLVELTVSGLDEVSFLRSLFYDPYRLHILLCSSYLGNWSRYFRYLGKNFQKKVRTLSISTMKIVLRKSIPFSIFA